jgi:hypothetical protein
MVHKHLYSAPQVIVRGLPSSRGCSECCRTDAETSEAARTARPRCLVTPLTLSLSRGSGGRAHYSSTSVGPVTLRCRRTGYPTLDLGLTEAARGDRSRRQRAADNLQKVAAVDRAAEELRQALLASGVEAREATEAKLARYWCVT